MNLIALEKWIGERFNALAAENPGVNDLTRALDVLDSLGSHAYRSGLPTVYRRCRDVTPRAILDTAREILSEAAGEVRRVIQEERRADPLAATREWFTVADVAAITGLPRGKVSDDFRERVVPAEKHPVTGYWRASPAAVRRYIELTRVGAPAKA